MMSCDQATYLLSQAQHQKLTFIKKLHLHIHLLTCNGCTQFGKQIKYLSMIIERVRKKASNEQLDEKYKSDIQQNIDEIIKNDKKS